MEYSLRQIEHGNPYPLNIPLNDDSIMIGSDRHPTLKKYPKVSPCHAHFVRKRGGWFVRDLDSTHGTFVNSSRIDARLQKLEIADHVGFGSKVLGEGFTCALYAKKPQKNKPIVIDLVSDVPVKLEPVYEIGSQLQENMVANWNKPSTSNGECSKNNSSQIWQKTVNVKKDKSVKCNGLSNVDESIKLKKCTVCLVGCDSDAFTFMTDVQKVSINNKAAKVKNVKAKSTIKHTKQTDQNKTYNNKSNSHLYRLIKECYVPLVRCDSENFSSSPVLQVSSNKGNILNPTTNKKKLLICKKRNGTTDFSSSIKKPQAPVLPTEQLFNKVNIVSGPINRRTISSDSSDSPEPDLYSAVKRRKRTKRISMSSSAINSPTVQPASVNRVQKRIIEKPSLNVVATPSYASQYQGLKLASNTRTSLNEDNSLTTQSEIGNQSQEEEEVVNGLDVEESYTSPQLLSKPDHVTESEDCQFNKETIFEHVNENSLRSEFSEYSHLSSSSSIDEAFVTKLGQSAHTNGELSPNSSMGSTSLGSRKKCEDLSCSDDSYSNTVKDDAGISDRNKNISNKRLKQKKKKQWCGSNHQIPEAQENSDSSVCSMDYIITPSQVQKNVFDSSEEDKNVCSNSSIKENVNLELLERKKSSYSDLLEEDKNLNVTSTKRQSSSKQIRKTLPVEALPLNRGSKKLKVQRIFKKGSASKQSSFSSKFSKRKLSPKKLPTTSPNGTPESLYRIPKMPQLNKQIQNKFHFQKEIETPKKSSTLTEKKPPTTACNSKLYVSQSKRLSTEMRTKGFKRRKKKDLSPKKINNQVCELIYNSSNIASFSASSKHNTEQVPNKENHEIHNISVVISNRIPEPIKRNTVIYSNLIVLTSPYNSFSTESLPHIELNSNPSSPKAIRLDEIPTNSKTTLPHLLSTKSTLVPISPNSSATNIAHQLFKLILKTNNAVQTSSVNNAVPITSIYETKELSPVTPMASTSVPVASVCETKELATVTPMASISDQLCREDSDSTMLPISVGCSKTPLTAIHFNALDDNSFSHNKFKTVTATVDPRIRLAISRPDLSSNIHQKPPSTKYCGQTLPCIDTNDSFLNSDVRTIPKKETAGLAPVTKSQVNLCREQLVNMHQPSTSIESKGLSCAPKVMPLTMSRNEEKNLTIVTGPIMAPVSPCYTQLSRVNQRLSSTESNDKRSPVPINFRFMIRNIVNLNLKWLEEQTRNNKPPPEVSKGAAPLPLFFNTYDQYVSSFVPMLRLEIWDKMFQEYKMMCEAELLSKQFYFIILSHKNGLEMSEYQCETLVDPAGFVPCEGNLVIMQVDDITGHHCEMFCYVHEHKTEQLNTLNLNSKWREIPKLQTKNSVLCKFSVFAKLRLMTPLENKVLKGNGICFVKNKFNLAEALQKLESSPLCQSILKPQDDVFSVNRDSSTNLSNESAVECLCNELRKPVSDAKILLLRGPPGTGKTYIITTLLQKLIHKERAKVKILLTAPTDVAVDEIGCRLIKKKLNFVRFGSSRLIHEKLRPFILSKRIEKLKTDCIKKTEQRKERLDKLMTEIAVIKITDSKCEKKLRDLVKEKLILENKIFKETSVDISQKDYQHEVLRDADVILATLGSCGDPLMTSVFKHGTPLAFTCCIVDHASQCTELDILPALAYGMSKLVLVGDPIQLNPLVNSKLTVQYGYEQSMFERFLHYFLQHQNASHSLTLQKQHRMHSEICLFPSKQFYNNGLVTPPEVDAKYLDFPFYPYIVYDISDRKDPQLKASKENCVDFIINICNQLLLLKKLTFSIGILVPTRQERSLFQKRLCKQQALNKSVEVNTVEAFQGREKDMIFMSCDSAAVGRPSFLSCSRRFNVALTRARKCLIICIGSNTLKQIAFWKSLIRDAMDRQLYVSSSTKDIALTFLPTLLKQT